MTTLKHLATGGVLAATLVLGACGTSSSDHDMGSMASPTTSSAPSSSAAAPANGPHNDADVMFASMMIPHHNQAIEMSNLLLAKGEADAQVTALAQKITAAQGPEVAQMSGWLAGWGANPSPSSMGGMAGMDHGDGMISQSEMDSLAKATGDQATRLFLTGMIKHHQGAVTMARTELGSGQNPDAQKLARDITSAQTAEIRDLQELVDR